MPALIVCGQFALSWVAWRANQPYFTRDTAHFLAWCLPFTPVTRVPSRSKKGGKTIMGNRLLKSFTALTMCCLMLALALPAAGQFRIEIGRPFGDSAHRVARQTEVDSGRFAATVDRAFDAGRFDETTGDTRLNERARDLERQLSIVSQDLDRGSRNYEVRSDLANALRIAEDINNDMRYHRTAFGFGVDREWSQVRSDLNRLARMYNLRQVY